MKYCSSCMKPLVDGVCPDHCAPASPPPPHILPPGTLLGGRYLVGASLGQGGFGITYIGRDQVLDIRVAIKEYYPTGFVTRNVGASPEVVVTSQQALLSQESEKFLAEARVLAKFIGEKGIVEVRDYFRENNTAYIVMEFLDGETLRDYIHRTGRLAPNQTFALMEPLMRSLDKVHQAGLIHRDISPDNIMLTRSDDIKLLDFGTARAASPTGEQSLSVMLKPGYAPEEQYRSKGSQGPWTDIYALCATMYRCITGVTPIDSLERLFEDTVVPPSQMGIAIDPGQEAALMKGMACRREDRFQSVGALAAALGMSGFTADAPAVPAGQSTVQPPEDDGRTILGGAEKLQTGGGALRPPEDDGRTFLGGAEELRTGGGALQPPEDSGRTILGEEEVRTGGGAPDSGTRLPEADSPAGRNRPAGGAQAVLPPPPPPEDPKRTGQRQARQSGPKKAQRDVQRNVQRSTPPRQKKKFPKFALIGVGAVIVLVLVIAAVWRSSNVVTVGGQTYTEDDTTVYFQKCTVTPEDLQKLTRLPNLKAIDFYRCDFAPGALEAIGGMPQIERVSFNSECANLPNLDPLAANPSLKSISLSCSPTPTITADFPSLAHLYIYGAGNIESLDFLSHCPSLITLGFRSCDKDEALVTDFSPIGQLTKLDSLYLSDSGVTDISFLSSLTELKHLDLHNSDGDLYHQNAISDLTPLANCTKLINVDLENTGLTSLAGLEGSAASLDELTITDNAVTSLTPLSGCANLRSLYASNNAIASLEGLEGAVKMSALYANDNQITDLTPLAGLNIRYLHLNNNQISDLSPLASSTDMEDLLVNDNDLASLAGCETLLRLETLCANDNHITDLNGIANCAVLENVQLDNNQLTDISLLGKNGENLQALEFGQNQVSSLSGLESCTKLQLLNCGGNAISSLAPVASMAELKALRASYNQISDLTPLESTPQLAYLDVGFNQIKSIHSLGKTTGLSYLDISNNQIADIAPLANLSDSYPLKDYVGNIGGTVLYMEHNQITDISPLPVTRTYWRLSLHGNPLQDLSHLAELPYANVTYSPDDHPGVYLPYSDALDYTPLGQSAFRYVFMTDTPLDKQVETERAIKPDNWGASVLFYSTEDFDSLIYDDKPGNAAPAGDTQDPPDGAGDTGGDGAVPEEGENG